MDFNKKYLKYKNKYLQLKNQFGGEFPKCSTFDELKKNPAHLAQFKTYLTQRKSEGKQNWLVIGAKYNPTIFYNETTNRNYYGGYTEASRFSNENWIFFDEAKDYSTTRYQFSGDATLVDNWKFLADNFNDLFHLITYDYLGFKNEYVKHMLKLLSNNGLILSNDESLVSDLLTDVDLNFDKIPLQHVILSRSNKSKLSESVYRPDCFFYQVRYIDNVPFQINSGGGGLVQFLFFQKIHDNSYLLKDPRLDKELLELYNRILSLDECKKPKCITESYWYAPSLYHGITKLIHEYSTFCKKNEDKVLSELVERLFSEEIELKMYQFIKEVSLEWKPPSHITLQNIWNEEQQQNPEVQLVNEEELKDEKIRKTYILYKYGEE
jgi:hypothetical protein